MTARRWNSATLTNESRARWANSATVELRGGDLDHACRIADDQLRDAGYATGANRLHEFRAAVDPWKTAQAVRMLDEQLLTLGA